MRSTCVLLLALVCAPAVATQTVQKCVSRSGQARYQSEPCGAGMRTAEVWDAVPDPVAPSRPAESPTPRTRRTSSARARPRRVYARGPHEVVDACAQARLYRDEAEKQAGLSRNYDLLSALQRRVFDACR